MPLLIKSLGVRLALRAGGLEGAVARELLSLFSRRYLPPLSIEVVGEVPKDYSALIEWRPGDTFKVIDFRLGDVDYFTITSPRPKPYVNESPYFFLLQVLARQYVKSGYLPFTDSISFLDPEGRAKLVLGFPHGGKSTLLTLAMANGLTPLTTENTVVAPNGSLKVVGGTRVLVVDPRALEKYGIEPGFKVTSVTKHGYLIVDLDEGFEARWGYEVSDISIIYCSFSSVGASKSPISGRKVVKLLWHFTTSLIRGDDFYEPYPLDLLDEELSLRVSDFIHSVTSEYSREFFEYFGSHDEVLKLILRN